MNSGVTVTMTGGEIKSCSATGNGGGIYNQGTVSMIEEVVQSGQQHNLTDGSIESCTAANGGGIYNAEGGTVDMTGGYIEKCTATAGGGGIFTESTATISGKTCAVNMHTETHKPGEINDCSAANGGGVYVAAGELDMTGGTIENCTATVNGGGVYTLGTLKLATSASYPGKIDKCSAVDGGGIYLGQAANKIDIEIKGGSILNCVASVNGGAICDSSKASITLDGVTIDGHQDLTKVAAATKNAKQGGGIYLPDLGERDDYLTIKNDCKLYNLTAEQGGTIYASRKSLDANGDVSGEPSETGCTISINGGEINGHTGAFKDSAEPNAGNGGMLYLGNGAVRIEGTKICNCTVADMGDKFGNLKAGSGGVIYNIGNGHPNNDSKLPTVELVSVEIDGHYNGFNANTVNAKNGGAIFMKMASLKLTNCTMKNLKAEKGAAIFARTNDSGAFASEVTIIGGNITGNTATGTDGGAVNVLSGKVANASGTKCPKLYFEGAAKVTGNTGVGGKAMNVVLEWSKLTDNNGIINVTSNGLVSGADIGVYVVDTEVRKVENESITLYDLHGVANTPFGTWANNANLGAFKNDRNGLIGTSYTDIDENDHFIYWQAGTSYIKLKNETEQPLWAKVIVDGGKYHEVLRKRGASEQSEIKAEGSADHYYYLFDLTKGADDSKSETVYFPNTIVEENAANKTTFTVELYEDQQMTKKVVNLLDKGIADAEDAHVKFSETNQNYAGTMKAGPRYKVKVTKKSDNTVSYITTPQKLDKNTYTYDKGDAANCYNEAEQGDRYTFIHIISAGQPVAFMKVDANGATSNKLNGAVFTLYTDPECTTEYKQKVNGEDQPVTAQSKNQTADVYDGSDWSGGAKDGVVIFDKIPKGIYYMKETTVPTDYSNKSDGSHDDIYAVIVGEENMTHEKLKTNAGTNAAVFDNITQAALDAQNHAQNTGKDADGNTIYGDKTYAIFKIMNGKPYRDPEQIIAAFKSWILHPAN